jgi:hypothetical protein
VRGEIEEGETALRNPIRGIFVGCCAVTEETVASKTDAGNQIKIFPLIVFAPVFLLPTDNGPLTTVI